MKKKGETPVVHLYAQEQWHGDAYILGNMEGLRELHSTLTEILTIRGGMTAVTSEPVFTADGEGYNIRMRIIEGEPHSEEWNEYELPYRDKMARGPTDENTLRPVMWGGFARDKDWYPFDHKGMEKWRKARKKRGS